MKYSKHGKKSRKSISLRSLVFGWIFVCMGFLIILQVLFLTVGIKKLINIYLVKTMLYSTSAYALYIRYDEKHWQYFSPLKISNAQADIPSKNYIKNETNVWNFQIGSTMYLKPLKSLGFMITYLFIFAKTKAP